MTTKMTMKLFKISIGNKKLDKATQIFSLPAGWSCPGALKCLTKVTRETGKVIDGESQDFRCYAASQEARPNVRAARWHNFELVQELLKQKNGVNKLADRIEKSLYLYLPKCRIHESGDFFCEKYFLAWLKVIKRNPQIKFYAYTKSLSIWEKYKNKLPKNFVLNASWGGKFDSLIIKNKFKNVRVFTSTAAAKKAKKKLDKDDSLAYTSKVKSFGLLIHGTQPAGKYKVYQGKLIEN